MSFQPNPNDELTIGSETYRVAEHPAAPGRGIAHGQEGRAGIVYRLVALTPPPQTKPPGEGVRSAALKVFKPRFRLPFLVSQAEQLAAHADLPGLAACRRAVLTPFREPDLLRQHPDLTYAVLMPWIEGPNWQEFLLDGRPLTAEQSLLLARGLTEILARMEERGLAHCDLSGPNVMLPALTPSPQPPSPLPVGEGKGVAAKPPGEGVRSPVELIDLEGFYAPGMLQPQALSSGSAGYAHQQAAGGLWGPEADRFAGAVLLAEMLGWCDPAVVGAAWGESYFEPGEMQADCERYRLLDGSLGRNWGDGVAHLFRRAWRSDTLADCPTFGEWLVALPERAPATVGQVDNLPYTLEEEPKVRAEPAPLVAEVRAFLQAARRMEERGNLDGALETYRQALELAQGEPALGSMAREIELTLQNLHAQGVVPTRPPERPRACQDREILAADDRVDTLFREGLVAYQREEWEQAKALIGRVVQLSPNYRTENQPPAWVLLARIEQKIESLPARSPEQWKEIKRFNLRQPGLGGWLAGPSPVWALAFLPDGKSLAAGNARGEVWLWDVEEIPVSLKMRLSSAVLSLCPGREAMVAGLQNGEIEILQVRGDVITAGQILQAHGAVRAVALTPDEQVLASASYTLDLWWMADGALLRTLEGHTAPVESVAFSPDGATLASGSDDNTVRLWRVADGVSLRTLEGHTGPVLSVAFSPDGTTLASGSIDNTVRLWRVADGALLQALQGHTDWVESVAFSPDGATLASGSDDNTVRLWRVADGALLRTLEGHTDLVRSVAFSPDGATLASGSRDSTVRLWGVGP